MSDTVIPKWSVGDRLRKSREDADLDQRDLAKYLGVSREAVSKWERNLRPISRGYAREWAQKCRVPYGWLAGDDPRLVPADKDECPDLPFRRLDALLAS